MERVCASPKIGKGPNKNDTIREFCAYLRINPHEAVDSIRSEASTIEQSVPYGIPGVTRGVACDWMHIMYTNLFSEMGKDFVAGVNLERLVLL